MKEIRKSLGDARGVYEKCTGEKNVKGTSKEEETTQGEREQCKMDRDKESLS